MQSSIFGVDLAKQVFQIHWVDTETGETHSKQVKRAKFLQQFANINPCVIGMEACGGAHHWSRQLASMGHSIRLLPACKVKPFVVGNKNDIADARAIWTAMQQPDMKFVAIKTEEQQAILAIHRMREQLVTFRTAQINGLRGLLTEFGEVLPLGRAALKDKLPACLARLDERLPKMLMDSFHNQWQRICNIDDEVKFIEQQLKAWFNQDAACQRAAQVPGIGVLTATALVASMGDPKSFKSGREFSAWLGIVPRQTGTGGRINLHGISKRGDGYLRKLLVHGARSVMSHSKDKNNWLIKLASRRPKNVAIIAQANKTARIVWALLAHERDYEPALQN